MYIKHFYDSVSLAFFVDMNEINTLADIGSGAGFPSIPLKIIFPHLKITIIDSLNKRIQFLNHLIEFLGLQIQKRSMPGRKKPAGKPGCGNSLILLQLERWQG